MHFQVLKNFKTAKKIQKQLIHKGFTAEQTEAILQGVMNIIEDGEFVTKPFLKSELAHFRAQLIEKLDHSEKKLIVWMVCLQLGTLSTILTLLFTCFKR